MYHVSAKMSVNKLTNKFRYFYLSLYCHSLRSCALSSVFTKSLFIIIENGVTEPCHAQLEFCVFLVSAATGSHTREARALRFWFKPQVPPDERFHDAQSFFRELVSPQDFPKGEYCIYRTNVLFFKKIQVLYIFIISLPYMFWRNLLWSLYGRGRYTMVFRLMFSNDLQI